MKRWPELSKLPKAKAVKFINFRYTTPGSPNFLLTPSRQPLDRQKVVDPSHPAISIPRSAHGSTFPNFKCDAFDLRAYPKAMLLKPETYWSNPPYGLEGNQVEPGNSDSGNGDISGEETIPVKANRLNMSVLCVAGKKAVHKKAIIRKKTVNKFKTALGLIVTRGATGAAQETGHMRLNFKEDPSEERKWVLQDWTYIFYPRLSVYRMPYPQLIEELRKALRFIWEVGSELEKGWCEVRQVESNKEKAKSKNVEKIGDTDKDLLEYVLPQQGHKTGYSPGSKEMGDNEGYFANPWSTPFSPGPTLTPRLSAILKSSAGEGGDDQNLSERSELSFSDDDINADAKTVDAPSKESPSSRDIPRLFFPSSSPSPLRQQPVSSSTDSESECRGVTEGKDELDVKNLLMNSRTDGDHIRSYTMDPVSFPLSPWSASAGALATTARWSPRLFQAEPVILPSRKTVKKLP